MKTSPGVSPRLGFAQTLRNASFSSILGTVLVILFIRWVIRGVYRVYFHPLSRFPGPKFAAFTHIPRLTALYNGKTHKWLTHLHQQYGDVVRISPTELTFVDPQAWRDVYGHGSKGAQGSVPHKAWTRYQASINGAESLVNAKDPKDHTRQRRIFNPAFSDRALKQQEPLFMKYVDMLVQALRSGIEENPERTFDMVRMYNFTTFDVMADLTFGESLHMLDNAEYDPWVSIVFASIKVGARLKVVQHFPILSAIVKAVTGKLAAGKRQEHFQYSVDRVSKRLERGRHSDGVDLWDLVLGQEEGKGLSRGEMDANSSLFMIAGTETTATLVSGLTYYLLTNPKIMKKLVEEIRESFSSSDDMQFEPLAALPYLNACIKEAFRRYPPVTIGMPRETPSNGSTICDQYVPPGVIVSAPQLAMYSSPRNFKDPESFIPERWLGDERFIDDKRAALQPFSVGTRDCLGKNMAYHEMRLIMAKVLYNFDLELCAESKDWANQDAWALWDKKPLMVKIHAV